MFLDGLTPPDQISSVQGALRQTALWHVHGCLGKRVSPRRRVTQSAVVIGASGNAQGVCCRTHSSNVENLGARGCALPAQAPWRMIQHFPVAPRVSCRACVAIWGDPIHRNLRTAHSSLPRVRTWCRWPCPGRRSSCEARDAWPMLDHACSSTAWTSISLLRPTCSGALLLGFLGPTAM